MEALNQQIEQAANLVHQARQIVAMTGAGISTPSGIPDFRSPESGLWDQVDPLTVASIFSFRQNPQSFYDWIRPLAPLFLEAKPNAAHYALAALEQAGKMRAVVTQNIDGLHGKAGSKTVYELHGHLREVTCIRCYEVQKSEGIIRQFIEDGRVPKHDCGGVFKPNVILFGEQLPMREFVAAQVAIKEADLMLLVGSSLETAPASDLPELALDNGTKMVIINQQPTYLDNRADLVIHANVVEVLPQILELVAV
ncbi:MAG: NAD-dependent deacylase [Anaerolineae bacterium]|nr:NAD-dependent deacylase [Anaerolineae bacterium]